MKISLEWLGDFLTGSLDARRCADALTDGGLPVESIAQVGGDTVLDVEVTSNRSDCLSHLGVARELAALLDLPLKPPPRREPSAHEGASKATVGIDAPDLCPHYTARIIENVRIGPSPDWMVRRLQAVGVRAINNVVDVTNYVLFEMGQPLHAFDFTHVRGGSIIVRRACKGEKLKTLDGQERVLEPDFLVIADAEGPVALAGVMGGLESEVTPATRTILLESARFDPLSVRKTARALAMGSDSSYRFERGIDPTLPARAGERAAQLIGQLGGGHCGPMVAAGADGYLPKSLTLRLSRLRQILGLDVPPAQVVAALHRLQFQPVLEGEAVRVTVPSWRLDMTQEIDLVEEVARLIGYDKIPVRDEISIRLTPPRPEHRMIEVIRSAVTGAGYDEAVTFSFVSDALMNDFTPPEAHVLAAVDPRVRSADAHLRPSLLPGLVEAIGRNENAGTLDARLFEMGATFWHKPNGDIDERRRLAMVGETDFPRLRGVVEYLLARLNDERPMRIVATAHKGFQKGTCGRIEWGDHPVGVIGMIDQAVGAKLSLRRSIAAAELDVTALLCGGRHIPHLRPLPRFPAVRRDLSLVVSESTPYDTLESLIRSQKPDSLEDVQYVTTYRGKPLAAGTKSVTLTLVFRSPSQTLTGEQVESAVQRIVRAAQEQLHATVRT